MLSRSVLSRLTMSRRHSAMWLLVVLSVYIFLAMPAEGYSACSKACKNINGHYSVGEKYGPPKFKSSFTRKDVTPSDRLIKIQCSLCESNPPSTLTWFFNDRPLDFKKNPGRIKTSCGENLMVRIASEQDFGNYTCVAKNNQGRISRTTGVFGAGIGPLSSKENIKLEGSVTEHEARIGSTINISCSHNFDCGITWTKDGERVRETPDKRIEWIPVLLKHEHVNQCSGKLVIRNVTSNDAGIYRCIASTFAIDRTNRNKTYPTLSLEIYTVPCFKGYYCPANDTTEKRCPRGTFSIYNNATSVDHCQLCPRNGKEEIRLEMTKQGFHKTAAIFRTNCPDINKAGKRSTLSRGQKIAVGVSAFVILILVTLPVLFGLRSWKKSKEFQEKLFGPPKDVEIEIPDTPLSNDVFVCYSSKNRQWVHDTLLVNLNKQNFKTFIDFIDFEAGLAISDNIANAIYGSRKTIFVLSNDSLKSFYARAELRQALAAGKTGHQVIVLMYEKCKIPSEITHIVYLDWTDEKNRDKFWEKLYRAIRRPLAYETNS